MPPVDTLADRCRFTLAELWVYPVKSCAGIRVPDAELLDTGLAWDRTWMVVDAEGEFVSQREYPRMAWIQPRLRLDSVELRAPGMLPLHLALEAAEQPCRVRVWDDEVNAYDMGPVAAQWMTDFLAPAGAGPLRLVRFDPEVHRPSSVKWTGGFQAPNQFSDGFPLLVLSQASLDDLNQRLAQQGVPPVGVERFRPNLVVSGVEAHDEDRWSDLYWPDHPGVRLQLVKPCARCSVPDVDPATGVLDGRVSPVVSTYRQDRRLDGAITFGMNAVVRSGAGARLTQGSVGEAVWSVW